MALLTFATFWWAALINRYDINVNKVDVYIPGLPSEFENYKIAQISDFHVGTYGEDTTYVAKVVERVNTLKPDLIVFTGDIVNSKTGYFQSSAIMIMAITLNGRLHAQSRIIGTAWKSFRKIWVGVCLKMKLKSYIRTMIR